MRSKSYDILFFIILFCKRNIKLTMKHTTNNTTVHTNIPVVDPYYQSYLHTIHEVFILHPSISQFILYSSIYLFILHSSIYLSIYQVSIHFLVNLSIHLSRCQNSLTNTTTDNNARPTIRIWCHLGDFGASRGPLHPR